MQLNRTLFDLTTPSAESVTIEQVSIGLGYTAVTTSDGGIGIAATGVALEGCCAGSPTIEDYEGRAAADLLPGILAPDTMERAMALALINALHHGRALQFPDDADNRKLFDQFAIFSGARVAMVGYFPPLVRLLEARRVPLAVIDKAKGLGDEAAFYHRLTHWADVLLLTATSIINNTTETILGHAGPRLRTVILGPSTPMLPAAFTHLGVHMLAGTAITDREGALKQIRHGGGARSLKAFSRKVYWLADAKPAR